MQSDPNVDGVDSIELDWLLRKWADLWASEHRSKLGLSVTVEIFATNGQDYPKLVAYVNKNKLNNHRAFANEEHFPRLSLVIPPNGKELIVEQSRSLDAEVIPFDSKALNDYNPEGATEEIKLILEKASSTQTTTVITIATQITCSFTISGAVHGVGH